MFKFNNTHILTGYIKQLLTSFNLPTYRIYTKEFADYHEEWLAKSEVDRKKEYSENPEILTTIKANGNIFNNYYIKGNNIMYCKLIDKEYKWYKLTDPHFDYDKHRFNNCRNLKIKNDMYDSDTHEYLGEYLRFLRDYNNVDLMSMYNCFSNKIINNINFKLNNLSEFNSANTNYKIYAIPVKLFKTYTIAIDCPTKIEMFCGFYNKYIDKDLTNLLGNKTYVSKANTLFNQPFIFDKLTIKKLGAAFSLTNELKELDKNTLAKREADLKLFLKIPVNNNSSIVILEGDYTGYNDGFNKLGYKFNKTVTNFEQITKAEKPRTDENPDKNYYIKLPAVENRSFKPISALQLLKGNTGVSYAFADRLIEFLMDNVTTNIETVPDNIKRTQLTISKNGNNIKLYGLWNNNIQNIIYDYMTSNRVSYANKYDITGYVDKDAETYYAVWDTVFVTDRDGNKIPLRKNGELVYEFDKSKLYAVTSDRNYQTTLYVNENQNEEALYAEIEDKDKDETGRPVYKTKLVPINTIGNIDIYDGLYHDN